MITSWKHYLKLRLRKDWTYGIMLPACVSGSTKLSRCRTLVKAPFPGMPRVRRPKGPLSNRLISSITSLDAPCSGCGITKAVNVVLQAFLGILVYTSTLVIPLGRLVVTLKSMPMFSDYVISSVWLTLARLTSVSVLVMRLLMWTCRGLVGSFEFRLLWRPYLII